MRDYYLDLMKKCLTNWIYMDYETPDALIKKLSKKRFMELFSLLKIRGLSIARPFFYKDRQKRMLGLDLPPYAHTMVGIKRLENIQYCSEEILKNDIPGDFLEAGVWRGGAVIFMRAILKAYGIKNRTIWVADSFEGLPKPNVEKYPQDQDYSFLSFNELFVSLDRVKANFRLYDLLDEQVYFLKGWFKDTLPKASIQKLALLRLDTDMYESTMEVLINLYHKLSRSGYIIIDDYNTMAFCRKAVDEYRRLNNINTKIIDIDGSGIYWRRE